MGSPKLQSYLTQNHFALPCGIARPKTQGRPVYRPGIVGARPKGLNHAGLKRKGDLSRPENPVSLVGAGATGANDHDLNHAVPD